MSYELEDLRDLLTGLLHCPASCLVDSLGVAGLLELLRTKGLWLAAVRYGYVYGALSGGSVPHHKHSLPPRPIRITVKTFTITSQPCPPPSVATERTAANLTVLNKAGKLWSKASLERAAALFEREWSAIVPENSNTDGQAMHHAGGAVRHVYAPNDAISAFGEMLIARMSSNLDEAICETLPVEADIGSHAQAWRAFVESAVKAFTSHDLLHATRQLLHYAKGSFGLVTSHSLECHEAVVIAARGQTMSIACYPEQGLCLWGSEAAATKVAMGTGINSGHLSYGSDKGASNPASEHELGWFTRAIPSLFKSSATKIGPSSAGISEKKRRKSSLAWSLSVVPEAVKIRRKSSLAASLSVVPEAVMNRRKSSRASLSVVAEAVKNRRKSSLFTSSSPEATTNSQKGRKRSRRASVGRGSVTIPKVKTGSFMAEQPTIQEIVQNSPRGDDLKFDDFHQLKNNSFRLDLDDVPTL